MVIYAAKSGTLVAFWDVQVPTYETCDGPLELDAAIRKFAEKPIAWHDRTVGDLADIIADMQSAGILPRGAQFVEVSPELAKRGVALGTASKANRKKNYDPNPESGGLFDAELVRPCPRNKRVFGVVPWEEES